jgi:hypothetical protein
MKKLFMLMPFTFIVCIAVKSTQADTPAPPPPVAEAINEAPAPIENNLSDLDAMTFTCSKAALNLAALEAKKAPSQGSYEFSFFRIATNSHHAQYEVHFKSNVYDEPDLKYCVSIYCQQGWDPKTAKATVKLISDIGPLSSNAKTSTHETSCGHEPPPRTATKKAKHKR